MELDRGIIQNFKFTVNHIKVFVLMLCQRHLAVLCSLL